MAADYIVVARTNRTTLGTQLIRVANLTQEVRDLTRALNGIMNHQFTGSDYSVMEAQFSLAAGAGANAATLLGLINTIYTTNTDVTGANRLSQLDELCARLAGQ